MPKISTPSPWASKPTPVTAPPLVLLLSQREAAMALSVSTRTVYSLARSGALPCVRIGTQGKGVPRFRLADIEAFISKNVSTAMKEEDNE